MAHHGLDEGSEMARRLWAEQFEKANKLQQDAHNLGLGPTGKFPEGKLTNEDEGEIRIGITSLNGKVIIHFGKPTAWIGFTPEQAKEIAASLLEQAQKIG